MEAAATYLNALSSKEWPCAGGVGVGVGARCRARARSSSPTIHDRDVLSEGMFCRGEREGGVELLAFSREVEGRCSSARVALVTFEGPPDQRSGGLGFAARNESTTCALSSPKESMRAAGEMMLLSTDFNHHLLLWK